MRKYKFYFSILLVLVVYSLSTSSAFPSDQYYVMESTAPDIDGEYDAAEWTTEEETFKDTITGLLYDDGSQSEMAIEVVLLRDASNLYVLYKIFTDVTDSNGSISVGVAISPKPIVGMGTLKDRKVAYYNGTDINLFDTFPCFVCDDLNRSIYPGIDDAEGPNFVAKYGKTADFRFFEYSIPLVASNATEDATIEEGTYMAFVVNPYGNMYAGSVGHSAISSSKIQLTLEPKSFLQRPEPGIDTLTVLFVGLFAVMISALAILYILSGRNDMIASKLWVINVTEKMAKHSLFMEIAYYNSNFLSMMLMLFLSVYSLIATAYGIWAGWGFVGYNITALPLVLSILSFIDLAKRNTNPAILPKEERTKRGIEMTKSPKFWIIPTGFLVLVLVMLTFIGIDVIT